MKTTSLIFVSLAGLTLCLTSCKTEDSSEATNETSTENVAATNSAELQTISLKIEGMT